MTNDEFQTIAAANNDVLRMVVHHIRTKCGAFRIHNRDLWDYALVGLFEATLRHEPSKGEFAKFAYRTIYGVVMKRLIREDWGKPVPPEAGTLVDLSISEYQARKREERGDHWAEDTSEKAMKLIGQLGDKQRTALVRWINGESGRAQAQADGRSHVTVNEHINKGLNKLRLELCA